MGEASQAVALLVTGAGKVVSGTVLQNLCGVRVAKVKALLRGHPTSPSGVRAAGKFPTR